MNTVMNSSLTANPWVILGLVVVVLVVLWILSFWVKSTGGSKELLLDEYRRLQALVANIRQIDQAAQESVRRDFVIQSDIWLDKVLSYNGMSETTTGEKLKSPRLKQKIDRDMLNDLWTLHKLRNQVVHDNNHVSSSDMDKALVIVDKIKRILV